jgi:hypothetical protein
MQAKDAQALLSAKAALTCAWVAALWPWEASSAAEVVASGRGGRLSGGCGSIETHSTH